MSKKNSTFDMSNFEFEIDDLEYMIKNRVNSNDKEKDEVLPNLPPEIKDEVLLPYFPPEIIYGILVKVPPRNLYQEFRLVCKAWKNMIPGNNFVLDNFAWVNPDFLVQSRRCRHYRTYRMEINEKQLDYKLHDLELSNRGLFRSSCYGMLLISSRLSNQDSLQPNKGIVLHVVNFVTSFCLTLPNCPSGCPHKECGMALGFDPCTNVFKVVHMYADGFSFEIFTIGDSSNAWKPISGPWNNSFERPLGSLDSGWRDPISINGRFLYWNVLSPKFVLSMDVSNEQITKIKLPCNSGQESTWQSYHLTELEGHLSLTYSRSNAMMDIWILEEIHGKWFKKHTIDANIIDIDYYIMTSHRERTLPDFKLLFPVAGTTNGVLVLMHTRQRCIYLYDTSKRKMKKFETHSVDNFILHRSSLFRLQ